jgi:hypothetical protein
VKLLKASFLWNFNQFTVFVYGAGWLGGNAGLHGVPLSEALLFPTLQNEVSSLCLVGKLSRGMACSYCCVLAALQVFYFNS